MKLPVRTKNAMLLGNGLIAHVRKVQEHQNKHKKVPDWRYMTYTQLRLQTAATFAMVGIGQFLGEIMSAIHADDMPKALHGLTLFVTPVGGHIDFSKGPEEWFGITPANAPEYRKAVLGFDWSDVAFTAPDQR